MIQKERLRRIRNALLLIFCASLLYGVTKIVDEDTLSAQEDVSVLSEPILQELQPYDFDVNIDQDAFVIPDVVPQMSNYALNGDKLTDVNLIINPVVFIEFADDTGTWLSDQDFAKIEEMYNGADNSLLTYFNNISFGTLVIQSEFFPKVETVDGITMKPTTYRSQYKRGYVQPKSASNPIGFDVNDTNPNSANSMRYHELMVIKDAMKLDSPSNIIGQISALADYYDWNLNLKYTKQGFDWNFQNATAIKNLEQASVDSFTFVMRGVGVNSGNDQDIFWPHRYSYPNSNGEPFGMLFGYLHVNSSNQIDKYDFINNYVVVPADPNDATNGMNILNEQTGLGVVVHEFFHQFYAPDLYRSSYKGQAVGIWDLMGAQQDMPQYPLLYTNSKFGIWQVPDFDEINSTQPLESRTNVTINKVNYPETPQHFAYKIVPDNYEQTKEYFMVEYREKASSGFDSMLGKSGLLVYRIHDGIPSVNKDGAFCGISCGNILTGLAGEPTADEVFVFRPNAANATLFDQPAYDNENLSNAALPRTLNGKKITSIGKSLHDAPAGTFDKETLYFSDGTNSGIQIVNISDPASGQMKFTVLYDGESLTQDTPLGDVSVDRDTTTMREGIAPADNTITIQGGVAPYTISIEEVKKDDVVQTQTLFQIVDSQPTDQSATLQIKDVSALGSGTYQVKVKVIDADLAEKTKIITYQVKKAYPSSPTSLSFTPQKSYQSSEVSSGTVLGTLGLVGCSNSGCPTDYGCDSIQYSIAFESGKDYSEYFSINPLFAQNGLVSASKNIPAGTYTFHGVATFKENGKTDVQLKNEALTIVIAADSSASSIPSISNIQGEILSGGWKNNNQMISFQVADENLGLKEVHITTSDGMLVNDAGEDVKSIVKSYDLADAKHQDEIQVLVKANGTYSITASNHEDKKNTTPASFKVEKIDQIKPILDTFTIAFQDSPSLATFTIAASDPVDSLNIKSDVKQIYYQVVPNGEVVNDGAWITYPDANTANWTTLNDSKFCVMVEDNALNRSEVRCKTLQDDDQMKPTIGIIQNLVDITLDNTGWTNAASVSLRVTVGDSGSGLATVKVSKNAQEVTRKTYAIPTKVDTYSFDVTENGEYQITVEDQNGNVETKAFTVNQFDKEKPVIDSLSASKVTLFLLFPTNDLDVVVNAHDMPQNNNSSFVTYRYIIVPKNAADPGNDDSTWTQLASDESFRIQKDVQGKVYVFAYDGAGNRSVRYEEEITVTEAAKDATLQSLQLQEGSFEQIFASNRFTYTARVPFTQSSIKIQGEATDAAAIITGDHNKTLPLEVGDNTFEIIVTNGEETSTYTITITRLEASITVKDATLQSLQLQDGTLEQTFAPDRFTYTAKVPNTTSSVQIISEATDATATITGDHNKTLPLEVGDNTFEIIVTNGEGTSTYTITITRLEASITVKDATLKSLQLQGGTLEQTFAPDRFTYTAKVPNTTSSVKIISEATDATATITGDHNKTLPLQVGDNTFEIVVTNGQNTQAYSIKITRLEATPTQKDATLKSLKVDGFPLTPNFQSNVYAYTATLSREMMSVTIQAIAYDTNAVLSGDANKMVSLKDGENVFTIKVSNQGEQKTYTVTLIKPTEVVNKSKDATLTSLSLSNGTLSPVFEKETLSYRGEVEHSVTSVKVEAIANDAKATLSKDANKTISLDVGVNELNVLVQAEDGTQKTYTIRVTRKAATQEDPKDSTNGSKELVSQDKVITVVGDFDESIQLVSTQVKSENLSITKSMSDRYQLQDIYDIHLEKADGTRYELTSQVKVRLALRDELKGKTDLIAVYIDEDGNVENMPTTIYEDYIEFTTNHFSTYAIAQIKEDVKQEQVVTGDSSRLAIVFTFAGCTAFVCVLLLRKRKSENEMQ